MLGCKAEFKRTDSSFFLIIAISCFHWERGKYKAAFIRSGPDPPSLQRGATGHPVVGGTTEALDLPATCPRRSTRRRRRESSESKLHYNHRLDYVVSNRLTVANRSSAPLNAEYPVWSGAPGRLTLTLASWAPSWGLLHGADGVNRGARKKELRRRRRRWGEKEREMSFK